MKKEVLSLTFLNTELKCTKRTFKAEGVQVGIKKYQRKTLRRERKKERRKEKNMECNAMKSFNSPTKRHTISQKSDMAVIYIRT